MHFTITSVGKRLHILDNNVVTHVKSHNQDFWWIVPFLHLASRMDTFMLCSNADFVVTYAIGGKCSNQHDSLYFEGQSTFIVTACLVLDI